MTYPALLFALVAGALIALQFGVNAALRGFLGSDSHPLFATLVSYAVGTLASLGGLLALRPVLPAWNRVLTVPWWAWTGGAIGVGYVSASVLLAPRLGATRLIVLMVAGQLLASVIFDHFGLIGYAVRPFNGWRALGCLLLVAAVVIIKVK
ncbi:MAG: DMT family transporter [Verrucomicrobia bacterium]|nr:DMT family transporter [Verrucomicrobiota bacterium]MBV9657953.1 DMT family transporter [Verrucomicrobiota bacterium]